MNFINQADNFNAQQETDASCRAFCFVSDEQLLAQIDKLKNAVIQVQMNQQNIQKQLMVQISQGINAAVVAHFKNSQRITAAELENCYFNSNVESFENMQLGFSKPSDENYTQEFTCSNLETADCSSVDCINRVVNHETNDSSIIESEVSLDKIIQISEGISQNEMSNFSVMKIDTEYADYLSKVQLSCVKSTESFFIANVDEISSSLNIDKQDTIKTKNDICDYQNLVAEHTTDVFIVKLLENVVKNNTEQFVDEYVYFDLSYCRIRYSKSEIQLLKDINNIFSRLVHIIMRDLLNYINFFDLFYHQFGHLTFMYKYLKLPFDTGIETKNFSIINAKLMESIEFIINIYII